jgi:hypothetical protein
MLSKFHGHHVIKLSLIVLPYYEQSNFNWEKMHVEIASVFIAFNTFSRWLF